MKWPWVSRLLYDQGRADLDYERYRAKMDRQRYETLLDKYHELRLRGGATVEPAPVIVRPEFDPVQAAITAKAGPDKRLRAMMSREAMQSRAAGIPDIEIIQAIEQGITVDMEGVV